MMQMLMMVMLNVPGCMDESACNYNADADVDDASCTYPAEGFDCEGNCLSGVQLLTCMIHTEMDGMEQY